MDVWRIATEAADYSADDVSGLGAKLTGGRWNRRGLPMVYFSSTIALACLETLVHIPGDYALPLNRCVVKLSVPAALWRKRIRFDAKRHIGWDVEPPGVTSLRWGDDWIQAEKAAIAEVPSVIVPEETNILINPQHKDATELRARKIRRWTYDLRLLID